MAGTSGRGLTDGDFADLFAARAGAVRRTAYLLCGDWHRADDLLQTAFAKLYAAWPRLRDPGAVDAYLWRTLTRSWWDESKRSWRRERPSDLLPDVAGPVEDSSDDRLDLLAALVRIPPRQRACVVLRYVNDLSVEATAAALGCTVGTVKSNTARGLTAMRQVLDVSAPQAVGGGA